MKITVNHSWAYDTGGLVVNVGDTVILPPGATDNEWRGEVTSLTSDYKGTHKTILGVVINGRDVYLGGEAVKKRKEAEIEEARLNYLQAKKAADEALARWNKLRTQ